ncbi:SDR family oxidoreductase [Draconibacterium sp.]|jgi:uncharacterized protein YbjT (DUF2867 family)
MRILLTGVTGYVGKRLLPVLIESGHEIICCVREKSRLTIHKNLIEQVQIVEIDFLNNELPINFPKDIDAAYYLIHSMTTSFNKFDELESTAAMNFKKIVESTSAKQVIYLSGISNENKLSKHLQSRRKVEDILKSDKYALTVLRAGIIVGSGSASFEIIRDLVEKLPVIIAPKWVLTKAQPISIRDIISYLKGVLFHDACLNQVFDIGGPEILTYKDMMLQYARVRKLKRRLYTTSLITPKISSYWLFFITSVSYKLAISLVDSMKMEVVCNDNRLENMLHVNPISYEQAIKNAFLKIKQNLVLSSWRDSIISSSLGLSLSDFIEVPNFGCYKNEKKIQVTDTEKVIRNIWTIGGDKGYYYANWLWKTRGFFDQMFGGVGLLRGRRSPKEIQPGDALDFWRVLYASREKNVCCFLPK